MNQPAEQDRSKWCARVLGRELGPMSAERLRRMLHDGEITPDDEVRRSHESDWSSAAALAPSQTIADFEILEPVVSSIAPIRIPRRKSDERVALIRERALATRAPATDPYSDHQTTEVSPSHGNRRLPNERVHDLEPDLAELDFTEFDDAEVPGQDNVPQPGTTGSLTQPPELSARPALSFDRLIQSIGSYIRAQKSRMTSSNGPTLREALAELTPKRWATPVGIVLACFVAVCGLVWLVTPSYQGTAFDRMTEIRKSVETAQENRATWSTAMQQLQPEVSEIADRMQTEATAENPSSQILLWATEQMAEVVTGSATESASHLKKYDRLMSEYLELTTGKSSG